MPGSSPKRTTTIKFDAQSFVTSSKARLTDFYDVDFVEENKIEDGDTSVIYRCYQKETGDERAVKVIQKSKWANDDGSLSEADFLKKMEHPNILKVYESFESDSHLYMVTEYCKGGELREEIFRGTGFSEYYTALLIKNILSAINYAYTEHSVVHLGLKPENILLPANRDTNHLKIIDFGSSIVAPKGKSIVDPKTKKLNRLVGAPAYLSPESLQYQTYSHKTDMWAIGNIAYLALSGFLPFEGVDEKETLELIVNSKKEMDTKALFQHSAWEGVSDDAIDFISSLLSYEQWKRPTAKQALQHPWMRYVTDAQADVVRRRDGDMAFQAMSNIMDFSAPTKLQQAALAFLESQLVDKDAKQDVDIIFQTMDISSRGRLSLEDFRTGFAKLFGRELPEDVAEALFSNMDMNESGFVEYSDFAVAAMDRDTLLTEDHLQKAFHAFDKDNSGVITPAGMTSVLQYYLGNQTDNLEEYIRTKIVQKEVSYDDFVRMMHETKASSAERDWTTGNESHCDTESDHKNQEPKDSIDHGNRNLYLECKELFERNIRLNEELGVDSKLFVVQTAGKSNPQKASVLGPQLPAAA